MVTVFLRHKISDYAAWRKVYDAAGPMKKAGGVIGEAVYQSADDPNDITVTHEFATIEVAKAYLDNPELKQAIQKAGVIGAPTVWLTNKV
jgi:quinol monooxygenase YgiN